MLDNYYAYKKEVDWSLLNQGLSIPLDIQVIFQKNIKKFIRRGESKDIYLVWIKEGLRLVLGQVLLKNFGIRRRFILLRKTSTQKFSQYQMCKKMH
jgi:hypothetical protein